MLMLESEKEDMSKNKKSFERYIKKDSTRDLKLNLTIF